MRRILTILGFLVGFLLLIAGLFLLGYEEQAPVQYEIQLMAIPTESAAKPPFEHSEVVGDAMDEADGSGVPWMQEDVTMSYYTSSHSFWNPETSKWNVIIDVYPLPTIDGYTINYQTSEISVYKNQETVSGEEKENVLAKAKEQLGTTHFQIFIEIWESDGYLQKTTRYNIDQP